MAGSGRKDKKRMKQANRRTAEKFKEARKKIRQANLAEEERWKARERLTYASGPFKKDCLAGSRKQKWPKIRLTQANPSMQGKNITWN